MDIESINIGIGGEAGAGVIESGTLLAKFAMRSGLYAFTASEYPSLIRGGHNYVWVKISKKPVLSVSEGIDILIALNDETIRLHQGEMREGGIVIGENDKNPADQSEPAGNLQYINLPLKEIAKSLSSPDITRNTIALGAVVALLKGKLATLEGILEETFSHKGEAVINMNKKAAQAGFEHLGNAPSVPFTLSSDLYDRSRVLLNGNDAISIAALKAGVKFAAIYPMTPTTSILEYLAAHEKEYNLVIREPEDEIAAINMTLGAAFSGVRALTATSGGGFCLMTEGISLAGNAELPVVIVEGMRSGPSTGIPTKTEQSDLRFVLHAGHGDFPKVVLAPGDPAECFSETLRAFDLSQKYQLPVIILTDKYLGGSYQVMNLPALANYSPAAPPRPQDSSTPYGRYAFSDSGVSPVLDPGQKGSISKVTSYEHDEAGHVSEDKSIRLSMMQKRFKKVAALSQDLPEPVLFGPASADLTIFGWGSTKGPALEAIAKLNSEGYQVNYLHLLYLEPFPAYTAAKVFDQVKTTLVVEANYSAQLAGLIREKTGRKISHHLLKYDGSPFTPEEISQKVISLLPKNKPIAQETALPHHQMEAA